MLLSSMDFDPVSQALYGVQMEETHSQLFKRLRLTPEQCTRMVSLWREWHGHRRSLDVQLEAACGYLSALPGNEAISEPLVALVSSRCMGHGLRGPAAEMTCRMQPQSLLGLCPVATQAAHTAIARLVEVHERDSQIQVRCDQS